MDNELATQAFVLAKSIAPFDTGNLMFNGMQLIREPHRFGIRYKGTTAPYIHYLEKGTKYSTRHKGFISVKTHDAILGLINAKRNGTFQEKQFAQTYNDVRQRQYTSRTNETLMRAIGSVR